MSKTLDGTITSCACVVMIAAMLSLWEVGIRKKTIIIISVVNVVIDCLPFSFHFFCLSFLVSTQLTTQIKPVWKCTMLPRDRLKVTEEIKQFSTKIHFSHSALSLCCKTTTFCQWHCTELQRKLIWVDSSLSSLGSEAFVWASLLFSHSTHVLFLKGAV